MSSNVISFMEHKWNADFLIEDLTDEFYETGTDQIKYWLTINKEKVIRSCCDLLRSLISALKTFVGSYGKIFL